MQLEEQKRVESEKETEKAMETDRRQSREIINGLEESWEATKSWCAESSTSMSGKHWNWTPEIKWENWEFLTQNKERREELTQWAEEYYLQRWFAWEERNLRELERIDMKAEVMAERRKEMMKVRDWRGDKEVLRAHIEESIGAEWEPHETKERKLDREQTSRTTREARRQQKRRWREQTRGQGEVQLSPTMVTAWEKRKRERVEMWEAPPPGPPLRREVRSKEKKKS